MTEHDRSHSELMRRLEAIYENAAPTPADAAALHAAAQLESLGADAAFVATLSEDRRTVDVARVTPYSDHPARLAFPVDAPYPLAAVIRNGAELFIESNEQLQCDHPGLVRVQDVDHACATLPLRDDEGTLIGALNLGFEDPHEFSDAEREQIHAIAARCAEILAELR